MNTQETVENPVQRPYVHHRWLYENGKAVCFACGISERQFEKRIENDSMLNWDCYAVRTLGLNRKPQLS